jgi:hypothetical protein
MNLIPVFGLASAVFWLGDPLTAARARGAILIGLSVMIFTAAELAEAHDVARAEAANVAPPAAGAGKIGMRCPHSGELAPVQHRPS